jgi:fermentation-respiration switch protein FrsA (DUF1100 family)
MLLKSNHLKHIHHVAESQNSGGSTDLVQTRSPLFYFGWGKKKSSLYTQGTWLFGWFRPLLWYDCLVLCGGSTLGVV